MRALGRRGGLTVKGLRVYGLLVSGFQGAHYNPLWRGGQDWGHCHCRQYALPSALWALACMKDSRALPGQSSKGGLRDMPASEVLCLSAIALAYQTVL